MRMGFNCSVNQISLKTEIDCAHIFKLHEIGFECLEIYQIF